MRVVKRTPILQRTPKSLERNERNRLLQLVDQRRNPRDIAIVAVLLYCGLQVGELVALNVKDIELKRGGLVYVNRGKGDKERVVPATSEVRSLVQEYLSQRGDVPLNDPLFVYTCPKVNPDRRDGLR
ncbi:tyrosine-type recombinase/integrase [Alicyclobacillus tolerans]|uniref:tyrosine-type recombinase/integrase n=1 Tax=Alicyclobacillus tolerans TaxID=90970 RepID=UPI003B7826EE